MMTQQLTRPNLYDYLKVFAIVTMVIDHVGYFLLPEIAILRAIGRWSFPVFLFLVGFNGSYRWRSDLWLAAGIVMLVMQSYIYSYTGSFGSLNILIGIGLARVVLDRWSRWCDTIGQSLSYVCTLVLMLILVVLNGYPASEAWLDYGLMVVVFALYGYLGRVVGSDQSWMNRLLYAMLGVVVYFFHLFFQHGTFGGSFGLQEWSIVAVGRCLSLLAFRLLARSNTPLRFVGWWDHVMMWFSRWALWIYVGHIVLLFGVRYFLF